MARPNSPGRRRAQRTLDARPDTLDFRDRMFTPTLIEVPTHVPLEEYRRWAVPILDQGKEGACTGFGLATVANYLLRRRRVVPDRNPVSPRMLYELAKRYDEWPGEDYSGSSARGAMKGWNRHGVCAEALWPSTGRARALTRTRAIDATRRPLGAYYRVNHKDLVAMHAAIAEVGVLFATAIVHSGWDDGGRGGVIEYPGERSGGHAFAIVAYDERGFWIQNSWGPDWGANGFARISYGDWLENGTDVWVARLGVPVVLNTLEATAISWSATSGRSAASVLTDLRPHIISLGNDGQLQPAGPHGTSAEEVRAIFRESIPEITRTWTRRRILLYAHGGLVDEAAAVQRLADYRATLLEHEIYPISFIWHSDYWSALGDSLRDALGRRRPEGVLDAAKDFMLDRLDDALEPLARSLSGKTVWDELKENAVLATTSRLGGARLAMQSLAALAGRLEVEIHVVGHSAGSIFLAPLVQLLTTEGKIAAPPMAGRAGLGLRVASCTLWAAACTVDLFKATYVSALRSRRIARLALFGLTDQAEQKDDCANIYHKSLLYLVSNALEAQPRIPLFRDGVPIVGMEKFVRADKELMALFGAKRADWVLAPNTESEESNKASAARHHGDFDDDRQTLRSTLGRILASQTEASFTISRTAEGLRDRRMQLGR